MRVESVGWRVQKGGKLYRGGYVKEGFSGWVDGGSGISWVMGNGWRVRFEG